MWMTIIHRTPAMISAGTVASMTTDISHPLTKAMINPAKNMDIVMMRVDTFSPSAPWKAKVSAANLDAS